MTSDTLIILATYNEMPNLPDLLDTIFETVPDVDVLVVDDNSPDGTGRWAEEKSRTESRLHVLCRPGKLGLGTAVLDAFDYAMKNGYQYLIQLDADFSHPVAVIPELRAAVRDSLPEMPVDVAIGSRYVRGGGTEGWSIQRKIMSRGINTVARLVLGLKTHDNSGSFRCYRVSKLRELDLSLVRSRGYSFFEEILYRLRKKGATFLEIPILFTDRTRGDSKINKAEALRSLWTLLTLRFHR